MRVYERNLPPTVNVKASFQSSDIPAARKLVGAAGHSHKITSRLLFSLVQIIPSRNVTNGDGCVIFNQQYSIWYGENNTKT
jgi:hypothetical protein